MVGGTNTEEAEKKLKKEDPKTGNILDKLAGDDNQSKSNISLPSSRFTLPQETHR